MLFQYCTAASLLALCSLSNGLALKHKRDTTNDTTLFAYGSEANGASVFYDNGLAYIGLTAPSWGTATNITFTTDPDDTTVAWTIAANSSTVSFNQTLEMYIIPTNGSFEQVGFVSSSSSAPTDAVTTGCAWFGTQVAYAASSSNYELMFWAATTNTTGIYALMWNAAGTPTNGSFPVVIKSTPPTTV